MASQRPLIIPWLIGKINSQMYPGVKWVNDEKTQFKLPWKHALRQDLSEDDIKLFEDWAIDSGCYDPTRHKADPARWKRNFRSALNQKDSIHLVEDNSSNSTVPHKVFEITRKDTESLYCDLEDLQNAYAIPDAIVPDQEIDYHISSSQVPTEGGAAYYEGAYAVGSDVPPGMINKVQAGQVQLVQEQEIFQQNILEHFTYNSFETDFEVNIYYRGTKVKSTTVTNRNGFCLTSRQQPPPNSYLEDVILPQAQKQVSDQILIQAVNLILTRLDQGTLVEVRDGAICARRLGNCRSFWAITDTPTTVLPNPIDKNDYSVLYTLQQFMIELMEFVKRRRKDSPQYSIWICLGETWPDVKPWRTKCIMVEIIPVVMRLLHELSYKTGASSLSHSDLNLEISDSLSSQSAVLSLLRSIEEKMDWGQI
ncbi:PREDICTED: interferon regulatory factor 5-like [Nanorana parkeri]|uniref:interferon regulatory factor 5-like n=1 Tax=Nanorana parkeri TaxID=125878 RepID=UPI00085478A1|nr:PREDICTED: interferon regulatory factor 5-like [Nanorana parkeri]